LKTVKKTVVECQHFFKCKSDNVGYSGQRFVTIFGVLKYRDAN